PRRCGKTTLLKHFLKEQEEKYLLVSGEDVTVQSYLSSQSVEKLKSFAGENKLLVVDEAQKVKNIGINIKLLLDHVSDIKIIATGSSSFDLARQIGEPLTGRKYTLRMFPLAQLELNNIQSRKETDALLEQRLIYGSYPEVILAKSDKERAAYLKEIVNSYLYKDILELEGIRHSDKLVRLLQLLAFQIGKEISYNEFGQQLGMSKNTVDKYFDLLQKTFVIIKLSGFSRNLRKEISKNPRYYFYDLGIRNALINNFNPLSVRNDLGMLWENYIIMERIKRQEYLGILSNNYFWRTYQQKEIDFIEERDGNLYGYEIKWGDSKSKSPEEWLKAYKGSKFEIITKDNYLEFIS
ncbi:MAG: AAA family ATPase, partial [Candidatus Omnitrophica bacterium]|nr:AAA family ATPase [Candidatus Omnitrophota bacterium]MBD3269821.1 AAA family ATPase [Candidatus Omnitrophota bacterium]